MVFSSYGAVSTDTGKKVMAVRVRRSGLLICDDVDIEDLCVCWNGQINMVHSGKFLLSLFQCIFELSANEVSHCENLFLL